MSSSKEALELFLEIDDDLIEAALEALANGFVHIGDDTVQLIHGFLNVRLLRCQKFIPFTNRFVFFNGTDIDFAQLLDPVLDLPVLLDRGRHDKFVGFELHGLNIGNFEVFPQFFL